LGGKAMKPKTNPWIEKIEPYLPPLENRSGFARLDFNENSKGAGKKAINAISRISPEKISMYPEYSSLEESIASYVSLEPFQILPVNGSDEGIKLLFDCFTSKSRNAIIPKPSFSMFWVYAQSANAKIYSPEYNSDFSFPAEKVLSKISKKTGIVVICSPNNPTGTSIKKNDLIRVLEKMRLLNSGIVLVDEAYAEFSGKSFIPLLKKFDNLVIARTFSKAFGLASLRVGYLASDEKLISLIRKAYSPYAVNYFASEAVKAVLSDKKYMLDYVAEIKCNRKELERFFVSKNVSFVKSNANFLLADFGSSKDFIFNSFKSKGILVRKMTSSALPEGMVRITIGDIRKNKFLISALEKIFSKPLLAFDLDGVIIDESRSYFASIKKTVEFFSKKPVTLKEIQDFKNRTLINNDWVLCEYILLQRGFRILFEKIVEKFQQFYRGKDSDGFVLKERLLIKRNLLKKIYQNYELVILTSRPRDETEFVLSRFGIKKYFSEIFCREDVGEKEKPNPFGLKKLLKNSAFARGTYFGDNVADMKAAKSAGFKAVGVCPNSVYSKECKKILFSAGAKEVLKNVNCLEGVLG
jgi:histidinol-phosphate aminotransferase